MAPPGTEGLLLAAGPRFGIEHKEGRDQDAPGPA